MMDILRTARRLEHSISNTVDGVARRLTQSAQREPLAVMLAIIDAVERETQQAGRGRQVFPFNRIKVSIAAVAPDDRARFEAVFDGQPSLEQRIVQRLTSLDCEIGALRIKRTFVAGAAEHWVDQRFHLEFTRGPQTAGVSIAEAPRPRIELKVVHGTAAQDRYSFSLERIDIGRCAEVRDTHNALLRTNHVAFTDDVPANRGVSRRQAHIVWDRRSAAYRIFDDRSSQGTCVRRDGRTIKIPSGSRGVRLESGDEITMGGTRIVAKVHMP